MPIFYFQQHVNGRKSEDNRRGHRFGSEDAARVYASGRPPSLLRKNLSPGKNTFVSTEVSDGKRTFYIVRGKVTSEKQ